MTIEEKINLAADPNRVYFFKEGLFYKLYNQNAMWFVSYIKVYKINSKFVKTVNQNVYSIGFPVSVIAQIEQQLTNVTAVLQQRTAQYATYTTRQLIENNSYNTWCKQHTNDNTNSSLSLKQQIQIFDLVNKTPMQALEFVSKLQKEL